MNTLNLLNYSLSNKQIQDHENAIAKVSKTDHPIFYPDGSAREPSFFSG
jgi:hypothetical protein